MVLNSRALPSDRLSLTGIDHTNKGEPVDIQGDWAANEWFEQEIEERFVH